MQILIASDHAGFALKAELKDYLKIQGYTVQDEGAYEAKENDDYPDFVSIVAKQVSSAPDEYRGIIIGGSGQGEAMCANRYPRVRAAVLYHYDEHIVHLSRLHNNSNVLSLGARFLTSDEAKKAVIEWLTTDFSNEERHSRRNDKLDVTGPVEHEF